VLVVSGNLMNAHLNVVWVCPLTSKLHGYAGNPQLQPSVENGLSVASEVLVVHLRSLDRSRLVQRLGSVDPKVVDIVHQTVAKVLTY
jgi:mRNA interferase MazF